MVAYVENDNILTVKLENDNLMNHTLFAVMFMILESIFNSIDVECYAPDGYGIGEIEYWGNDYAVMPIAIYNDGCETLTYISPEDAMDIVKYGAVEFKLDTLDRA